MKKIITIALTWALACWVQAQSQFLLTGYDSHIELEWERLHAANSTYLVEASVDGKNWETRFVTEDTRVLDFVRDIADNVSLQYRLKRQQEEGGRILLAEGSARIRDFSDDELMEMVQKYTFRYFWEYAEPNTGWARERKPRLPNVDIVTTGGTGFGIASIITAAQRGWVSREQAVARMAKIVDTLDGFERFHGMWAHWYDAKTGEVFNFSAFDDGGDVVESAFMAQGMLTARQYFNADTAAETRLRATITRLWEEMEWDWYTQNENVLYWHWSKNYDWIMDHKITGYNESLIAYILAASSPTHPIRPEVYHEGWASWDANTFRNYEDYYGMALPLGQRATKGGPLFFAHYSFMGLDPRGLRDQYANYWEQNKRHTLINRAYCIDNPYGWAGYSEELWGLSAGDMVPAGYTAHAPGAQRDHGTIQPTAALSSMPYTPDESMKVLRNLYRNHGKYLFGEMGFYDGLNLSFSSAAEEQVRYTYLAIDQGPIVGMIENHRSGLLWQAFMANTEILDGLTRLGFSIDQRHQAELLSQNQAQNAATE
ncbi:beta-glucosidase [Salinimonas marina]|uniref:Beta-glucosidase n=1 Tax=Salinimonas marina TaxID=2785918 RepID=A0A7S9DXM0_9ALTE|nr:glucoamylase family protein [Salinimonas marina]QPG05768.1 beta-glucosidase [Salinimonas marina]